MRPIEEWKVFTQLIPSFDHSRHPTYVVVRVLDSVYIGVRSNTDKEVRIHVDARTYTWIRVDEDGHRRGVGNLITLSARIGALDRRFVLTEEQHSPHCRTSKSRRESSQQDSSWVGGPERSLHPIFQRLVLVE